MKNKYIYKVQQLLQLSQVEIGNANHNSATKNRIPTVPMTATIVPKIIRAFTLPIIHKKPKTETPKANIAIAINIGMAPKPIKIGPRPIAIGPKQIKRENNANIARTIRDIHQLKIKIKQV